MPFTFNGFDVALMGCGTSVWWVVRSGGHLLGVTEEVKVSNPRARYQEVKCGISSLTACDGAGKCKQVGDPVVLNSRISYIQQIKVLRDNRRRQEFFIDGGVCQCGYLGLKYEFKGIDAH